MGLQKLSMAVVQRWIGRREHVDRRPVGRDLERDEAPAPVVVENVDEVGRKVISSADHFAYQLRIGNHEGVLTGDLPHGSIAPQRVVERSRVIKDIGVEHDPRIGEVNGHHTPLPS